MPNQPCVVHDLFFHSTSSTVTHIHLTVKGLLTRANPSVFGFLKCFKAIFPTVGVWQTLVSFLPRWLFFLFNFKIRGYFQGNAVHMFLIYLYITHKIVSNNYFRFTESECYWSTCALVNPEMFPLLYFNSVKTF